MTRENNNRVTVQEISIFFKQKRKNYNLRPKRKRGMWQFMQEIYFFLNPRNPNVWRATRKTDKSVKL